MKRGWQIATLGFIVFAGLALVIGVWGASFINARPLPLKDALGPGPGFFPMWLSILTLLLGVGLLVEVGRRSADYGEESPYPQPSPDVTRSVLPILALLALVAWKFPTFPLLERIGVGSETVRAVISTVLAAGCTLALVLMPQRYDELSDNASVLRIGAVLGLLVMAAATLEPLGFRVTAFLFTALLLPALGARNLRIIVPFVLSASLGVFYIFYHQLKVPLPIGPYDWIFKPIEAAYFFIFR